MLVCHYHTLIISYQTLGCRPIASLDHFLPEHLGSAQLVEEVPTGSSKVVKVGPLAYLMNTISDTSHTVHWCIKCS